MAALVVFAEGQLRAQSALSDGWETMAAHPVALRMASMNK
jgi:hypothetical protein